MDAIASREGLGQKAKIIYEPPEEAALLADRMLFSDVGDVSLGAPYPSAFLLLI